VVGVVVTGGLVVGGVVPRIVVVGGAVVAGGLVTGVVVAGAVGGTSVLTTPGFRTVVGGDVVGGVDERVAGAAVTVGATATVLVVVELAPDGSAAAAGSTAAKRLPRRVVVVVGTMRGKVSWGRVALAREPLREESREVAAVRRATTTAPTPKARRMLVRAVLVLAYQRSRSHSEACGRPKAAFLPMNEGKR
jgi:hypothetical protein